MEGTLGSDDDKHCSKVADSMVGANNQDRFIFVVNKMDDRKETEIQNKH